MGTYAFSAPIIDGQLQNAKNMISQILGDRRSDAEALRKRAGLDREQVYIQTTPMGEFAIIVWDCDDFNAVLKAWASDTSEHAQWFRGCLQEIHGFDIADTANAPTCELVAEWKANDWTFDSYEGTALCFPIAAGQTNAARAFAKDMMQGAHKDDFVASRTGHGIKRQCIYVQSTPNGDVAVMFGEGNDGWFKRLFADNQKSTEPFYVWFRENMQTIAGVPMLAAEAKTPVVEQVFHMTLGVPAKV
jgi:hypothetical protein